MLALSSWQPSQLPTPRRPVAESTLHVAATTWPIRASESTSIGYLCAIAWRCGLRGQSSRDALRGSPRHKCRTQQPNKPQLQLCAYCTCCKRKPCRAACLGSSSGLGGRLVRGNGTPHAHASQLPHTAASTATRAILPQKVLQAGRRRCTLGLRGAWTSLFVYAAAASPGQKIRTLAPKVCQAA